MNTHIFVTGASGLIGQHLYQTLQDTHHIHQLHRINNDEKNDAPDWDINVSAEHNAVTPHAIVHLAGENIAAKRWSHQQKKRLFNSRITGTKNLVEKILKSDHKPSTFLCASAIGFYGDRGDEILTETSPAGDNFSALLSKEWEEATKELTEHGIRVVNLRFGVVLSQTGGALKKMLLPFKCGLGGAIGNGQQHFSWISITDAVEAVKYILNNPDIHGPVNITAPNPVTNKLFSKTLAKALKRPAFLDMPAGICRLLFGEMADELLLSSQHVIPDKLLNHGYIFRHLDIEMAFSEILS